MFIFSFFLFKFTKKYKNSRADPSALKNYTEYTTRCLTLIIHRSTLYKLLVIILLLKPYTYHSCIIYISIYIYNIPTESLYSGIMGIFKIRFSMSAFWFIAVFERDGLSRIDWFYPKASIVGCQSKWNGLFSLSELVSFFLESRLILRLQAIYTRIIYWYSFQRGWAGGGKGRIRNRGRIIEEKRKK